MTRRALVLGGTGHVGAAVLEGLAAVGVPCRFTWHQAADRAAALGARLDQSAHRLDLRREDEVKRFASRLIADGDTPDVIVHAAAHPDWRGLDEIDAAGWDDVLAVAVRGPFLLLQALATPLRAQGADIVFATGMAAMRPGAAPPQAAAAHAALGGLARSLTRSLAPRVRVNVVCLATLDGGTATRVDPCFPRDQQRFSALARVGTAPEVTRAILWLALENRYISGAMVPVAGGL